MSSKSAPAPNRRFLDHHTSGPTLISAGSEFHGDLRCSGDLALSGAVVGDGDIQGSLTLAGSARWEGTVQAIDAVLAGTVVGHVIVREKLEIRKTARINGGVSAKVIAIAEGALIEGDIQVLGDAPVVHFQEKRTE